MTPAVTVSALVVNYRSYVEVDACLRSLLPEAQDELLEVIVVDNASVVEKLEALSRAHPSVSFFGHADNPGFAAAVNEAARRASGNYLLLLNPDAVARRGATKAMARYLDDHPNVAVVGPRVYDPDGQLQRSARSFPNLLTAFFGRASAMTRLWPNNPVSRRNLPADESTASPTEVDWVAGSCLMVRANAFHGVGGFDERFFLYWEDADLCHRLRENGWRIVHVPSAAVVHQCGRSSRHASARSIAAFHRSAWLYYAKHRHGLMRYPLLTVAAAGLGTRMAVKLLASYLRDLSSRSR